VGRKQGRPASFGRSGLRSSRFHTIGLKPGLFEEIRGVIWTSSKKLWRSPSPPLPFPLSAYLRRSSPSLPASVSPPRRRYSCSSTPPPPLVPRDPDPTQGAARREGGMLAGHGAAAPAHITFDSEEASSTVRRWRGRGRACQPSSSTCCGRPSAPLHPSSSRASSSRRPSGPSPLPHCHSSPGSSAPHRVPGLPGPLIHALRRARRR